MIGRARGLADLVHSFCGYDVVVDTGRAQVEACVAEILASLTSTGPRRTALSDGPVVVAHSGATGAIRCR